MIDRDTLRRHPLLCLFALGTNIGRHGDRGHRGTRRDRGRRHRTRLPRPHQCWTHTERVALTAEQVTTFDLPPMPGKTSDSRAATFTASHGRLVQVEVDAAIARWWNTDAHAAVFAAERDDQDRFNRP